ncbi:hypothetical protein SDC9_204728 [bioreactor metagenome]|uniref:Uncharacterized protein n=1 Tax=bioreactor metagenome TaxID=1076179 RepID=A0A645J974_9ZZZZ
MHQPPFVEVVAAEVYFSAVRRVKQILSPGDEQPDDGTFLFRNGAQYPLGLYAAEQHGAAAGNEASEPVHLGSGMVKRRYAEKYVVARLAVVLLFADAGGDKRPVIM